MRKGLTNTKGGLLSIGRVTGFGHLIADVARSVLTIDRHSCLQTWLSILV